MVSKILHFDIMDLQMQLRVGRSAGAGRGHRGRRWVVEVVPDKLRRERQGAGEGSARQVKMGPGVIRVVFHPK